MKLNEYLDFKEDEKYCYIYTEFIEGETIEKKLEKLPIKSFENDQVHNIINKLINALSFIHKENIIHRDLKNSNIMISNKGELKIIDFGLSKLFEKNSKNHSFTGTLCYMAPEVFLCNNTASRKSDIWSLACLIIELCGGEITKNKNKINQFKDIPVYIPPTLKLLLNNCLNIDPNKRININQLLNHPYITKENKNNNFIFINEYGQIINNNIPSNEFNLLFDFLKESNLNLLNIIEIGLNYFKIEILNNYLNFKNGQYIIKYSYKEDFIKGIENYFKINHKNLSNIILKKHKNLSFNFIKIEEGITLKKYIEKFKKINEIIIIKIIKQILKSIIYLLNLGINDIYLSIDNIFINNQRKIIINLDCLEKNSTSLENLGNLTLYMNGEENLLNNNINQFCKNFIQHCYLIKIYNKDLILSLLDHCYLKKNIKNDNNVLYWDINKILTISSIPNYIDTIIFGSKFNKLFENLPNNITSLKFGSNFNQIINLNCFSNSIKSITFGRDFNHPLSSINNNSKNIIEINYGGYVNQPLILRNKSLSLINSISRITPNRISTSFNFDSFFLESLNPSIIPNSCSELKLGYFFNNPLILPSNGSLTKLILSDCYNLPLTIGSIPKSVKHLTFGDCFNQPLNENIVNNEIEEISFGNCFNQIINEKNLPITLKKLSFGFWFNQPIKSLTKNLVSLSFGDSFNQSIDDIFLNCIFLKELKFGYCFDFYIKPFSLPINLESLKFGGCFSKQLEIGTLPLNLKKLAFGINYNNIIKPGCLSNSLESLTFGDKYNKPILSNSIPIEIKELNFGDSYEFPLSSNYIYNGAEIEILNFNFSPKILKFSPKIELNINQIPPSVTDLILLNYNFNFSINSLPLSIISLTLINYLNIESLLNLSSNIIDLNLIYNYEIDQIKLKNQISKFLPKTITLFKLNNEIINL